MKKFKRFQITQRIIEDIKKHPSLYLRVPLKTQMGKIYTDEEFEMRSDRVLKKEITII